MSFGIKTNSHNLSFNYLKGNTISCEENVKLLGVIIDSQLNFNKRISEICIKNNLINASQQLNR